MSIQFYGKEGNFKPIDAQVNIALNRDAQASKQEIENLKFLKDGSDQRDSEYIAALKTKYKLEDVSKETNKTRLDKNWVAQQNAIKRNKDRKRQDLEIELQNIRNEAKGLQAFTQTGSDVLNKLADRQQRKIDQAAINDFLKKESIYRDFKADVEDMAFVTAAAGYKDGAFLEFYNGSSQEAVSYRNTLPPALQIVAAAKISADLNNEPTLIKQFFADRLRGQYSYEQKLKLLNEVLPAMFLQQIGLSEYRKDGILNPLRKTLTKVSIELENEIKSEHHLNLGTHNISQAQQLWKGSRGREVEKGNWENFLKTIENSSDKNGVRRGVKGTKAYIRGMLVDPNVVQSDAEYNRILDMDTLPNRDNKGNITQAARPFRQVFSPSELYEIKKERLEKEDEIIKTEDLKTEIYSGKVEQEVRRAIIEDWDGSPEMKDEIFAEAPGLSDKAKKRLEDLTVQIGNNTDLREQRKAADKKLRDGVFFEDDYLMLSPSLRAMDKYRKGYKQISDFVAKTGWDKATVSGTFKDFIQNDILKVQNTPGVVTPTLNRTVKPAIAEATKDFYRYISEFMDDPEIAKHGAEHVRSKAYEKITKDITEAKGKWRVDSEYKGAEGKNIGDTHFPYFDGANTGQYNVKYPAKHVENIIEEEGSEFLKTTLVIDAAHLKSQENAANKGDGLYCLEEHKDIAEKANTTVTNLYNDQRALVGLDKLEPSVRDEVVKSAEQIEQNNAAIIKLSKNIRSLDDALKARIAQNVPRLPTAMTSTSRWQLAVKGAGIPIGTYKTVEQLSTFPAGQQILGKYFGPNGNIRGGAVVGRRIKVKGGTQLVIQLPGSDPNEPRHIYLFRGDM